MLEKLENENFLLSLFAGDFTVPQVQKKIIKDQFNKDTPYKELTEKEKEEVDSYVHEVNRLKETLCKQLKHKAQILKMFHNALTQQGFTPNQAVKIVCSRKIEDLCAASTPME